MIKFYSSFIVSIKMKIVVTFQILRFSTMEIEKNITVNELKDKLTKETGLSTNYLHLTSSEKWFYRGNASLEEYGINP